LIIEAAGEDAGCTVPRILPDYEKLISIAGDRRKPLVIRCQTYQNALGVHQRTGAGYSRREDVAVTRVVPIVTPRNEKFTISSSNIRPVLTRMLLQMGMPLFSKTVPDAVIRAHKCQSRRKDQRIARRHVRNKLPSEATEGIASSQVPALTGKPLKSRHRLRH
jgi:hypothetical protein